MGLMNTLRKFCIMKGVRDKAKEESESQFKDKYDEKMAYVGITERRFMMTTKDNEINKMRNDVEKNIDQQVSKLTKMSSDELNALYEDVKQTKNSFRGNENRYSRTGQFDKKAEIVYFGLKRLQESAKNEIEKRNKSSG